MVLCAEAALFFSGRPRWRMIPAVRLESRLKIRGRGQFLMLTFVTQGGVRLSHNADVPMNQFRNSIHSQELGGMRTLLCIKYTGHYGLQ
ncbi:hypothetical protein BDW60DRAFT_189789 [Aspergillus nidulans var. acristatus]